MARNRLWWEEVPYEGLPWDDRHDEEEPEETEVSGIGFVTEEDTGDENYTSDGEPRPNDAELEQAKQMLDDLRKRDASYLLKEMHIFMLADILAKLKTGIATHQEMAIARNLLRDNGFTVPPTPDAVENKQREIARERTSLPSLTEPEYGDDDEA